MQDRIYRPAGQLSVAKIVDCFGKEVSFERAVKYGWLKAELVRPGNPEVDLGTNLFLDNGRQLLTYLFGFRAPIGDFACQRFGVGTGTTAAKVTDVSLESPVVLVSTGEITAPITSVDFYTPFVVRIGFTLAAGDANGNLITEFGLYSGNKTLMTRKVQSVGINKTSDASYALSYRIRM